ARPPRCARVRRTWDPLQRALPGSHRHADPGSLCRGARRPRRALCAHPQVDPGGSRRPARRHRAGGALPRKRRGVIRERRRVPRGRRDARLRAGPGPRAQVMNDGLDLGTIRKFLDALLIGALVGIEREKRKSAEANAGIGGLRTFILVALLGAIAGWLTDALHMPALFVAVVVVVGAAVLAGYVLAAPAPPEALGVTPRSAAHTGLLPRARPPLGPRPRPP